MKHFFKLFVFSCMLTIFACPIFAETDIHDLFPIVARYGSGDYYFDEDEKLIHEEYLK